jgi:hypothetical protein
MPTGRRKKPAIVYVAQVNKPFDGFAGWQIIKPGQAGEKGNLEVPPALGSLMIPHTSLPYSLVPM